jgi:hypothetical protein
MASRKPTTAKELLDALAADPEHRELMARKRSDQAAFVAEFADEERAISREAKALGYTIKSVWDFVNNTPHPFLERLFVGPYERAYPMLVRHLQLPHHPRVREGIIRALAVRDGGEAVWQPLYLEFTKETDKNMRWVLANALKVAMPYRKRVKVPEIARVYKSRGAL